MEIAITIILVLLATVLLTVEVALIPGFGVAGILGVLSMLASVFYAFFVVGNVAGWITIIVSGLICVSLFLWALYGKSLDRLALKKNIDSNVKGDELDKIKGNFPAGLAVDMESAAIAQTCHIYGVPFVSFRIISDTPGVDKHIEQYENFWGEMADRSFGVTRRFLMKL